MNTCTVHTAHHTVHSIVKPRERRTKKNKYTDSLSRAPTLTLTHTFTHIFRHCISSASVVAIFAIGFNPEPCSYFVCQSSTLSHRIRSHGSFLFSLQIFNYWNVMVIFNWVTPVCCRCRCRCRRRQRPIKCNYPRFSPRLSSMTMACVCVCASEWTISRFCSSLHEIYSCIHDGRQFSRLTNEFGSQQTKTRRSLDRCHLLAFIE